MVSADPPGGAGRASDSSMRSRQTITATKLTALSTKQGATPTLPTTSPASIGPKIRVMLKLEELSAMAFMRSSFPTISTMNACRMGTSKAAEVPWTRARAMTQWTVTWPVSVSSARARASASMKDWSRISARRRWTRSASTPPHRVNSRIGSDVRVLTSPT